MKGGAPVTTTAGDGGGGGLGSVGVVSSVGEGEICGGGGGGWGFLGVSPVPLLSAIFLSLTHIQMGPRKAERRGISFRRELVNKKNQEDYCRTGLVELIILCFSLIYN